MRSLPRFIPAIVLLVLYAMIVMSQLAPLALHSPLIAHAVTGECASDCSICGCSPERSANHTCCCWMKKTLPESDDGQDEPECCRRKHESKSTTSTISSRPCGSSKVLALFGTAHSDLLFSHFRLGNLVIFEASIFAHTPARQSDWPGDPPDPPPRLFLSS
jgi:hypothetical protein